MATSPEHRELIRALEKLAQFLDDVVKELREIRREGALKR